ncbi:hypothetical protein DMN91_005072 [Ooceraea biroi]|uniref:Uncharacterized protein n=1 Tax=Ooceraea biroi TaxID=2015173 RepID=A0A3L8DQT6_OOCBI|nr:hypothetical protein DMN91_005072 [Ooceraea biroi]
MRWYDMLQCKNIAAWIRNIIIFNIGIIIYGINMLHKFCSFSNNNKRGKKKKLKILRYKKVAVLGLRNVGKTSLIKQISATYGNHRRHTLHNTVFVYSVKKRNYLFHLCEFFGCTSVESLSCFHSSRSYDMIMYLIDSTKRNKLVTNITTLKQLLEIAVVNMQVLVVATKQEFSYVITVEEIKQYLKQSIHSHQIEVIGSRANPAFKMILRKNAFKIFEKLFTMALSQDSDESFN